MFGRIRAYCRRRFALLIADEVALLRHDVSVWKREHNERIAERDSASATIDELRKAVEFYNATRQQAEQESESLANQVDALTAERDSLAEQLKAADAAAQMLREELAAERAELEEVRHELEKTGKQLELATQENRLLSEIHEADFQRRRKEKELEITQSELAIAEARRYTTEQHLEAA